MCHPKINDRIELASTMLDRKYVSDFPDSSERSFLTITLEKNRPAMNRIFPRKSLELFFKRFLK